LTRQQGAKDSTTWQHGYKGNTATRANNNATNKAHKATHNRQHCSQANTAANKAHKTTQRGTKDNTTDKATRHRTQHNAATMVTRLPSQQGYQGISTINKAQKTTHKAKKQAKGLPRQHSTQDLDCQELLPRRGTKLIVVLPQPLWLEPLWGALPLFLWEAKLKNEQRKQLSSSVWSAPWVLKSPSSFAAWRYVGLWRFLAAGIRISGPESTGIGVNQ
jgi:hypothetical protein